MEIVEGVGYSQRYPDARLGIQLLTSLAVAQHVFKAAVTHVRVHETPVDTRDDRDV